MENQEQSPALFEMQFDENAKSIVLTTVKWAMIIVITSLVGYVVAIIAFFRAKSQVTAMSEGEGYDFQSSYRTVETTSFISVLFSIGVGLLVTYFLYKFASNARKGMETMSSYHVNIGFSNFKSYFLVIGILMILAIVLVGFAIIGLLAMSGSRSY